jgi:hypothetical protein
VHLNSAAPLFHFVGFAFALEFCPSYIHCTHKVHNFISTSLSWKIPQPDRFQCANCQCRPVMLIQFCKYIHIPFVSPSPPFEISISDVGVNSHLIKGDSMKNNDEMQDKFFNVMADVRVAEPV